MNDNKELDTTNGEKGVRTRPTHSDAMKGFCFELWVLADRDVQRAYKRLVTECEEPDDIPDVSTLYRWAKSENWAARADTLIADTYPHITQRQLSRLITQTDMSLDATARILDPDVRLTKEDAIRAQVALKLIELRGLIITGAPQLQRPTDDQDDTTDPHDGQRKLLTGGNL